MNDPLRLRGAPVPVKRGWTLDEKFVGEKLLQYAGMIILTLGVVFFLIWTAAHAGPLTRVLLAAATAAATIFAGLKAEKKPPYDQLSGTLIGGGWTILYVTAYAAGHWEPTKVLASSEGALGALLAAAGGMLSHAITRRSRPLRLYAVSLTYFVMMFCGRDVSSFDLFLILFGASAVIAVACEEADVLLASLLGYHLNYLSVYARTIALAPAQRTVENFISPFAWLAGAYLIVAALPLIPRAKKLFGEPQARIAEAALCLNSILFALVAGSMGRLYFGVPRLSRAAFVAALFAVPGLLYGRFLSKRSVAAGVNAVLALGLLAAAIFEMPDPMWKLLAWIFVSCGWVWIGMFFDRAVWRAAGLVMAMMTFGFYWNVVGLGAESRREASMALFVFTGLAYLFSRFHRLGIEAPEPWEKPLSALWLHAGSLALVLGLWGVLDPAPLLCALCALAIAAEYAAQGLRRVDFWNQAVVVQFGLGAYSFFIDYGADAPVLGLPVRAWTSAVALATYGYLHAADLVDPEVVAGAAWAKEPVRDNRTWVAAGLAAYAIYHLLDGRLRLPAWALWSLGLYWVGRAGGKACFKRQAVAIALLAAGEAALTYWAAPSGLLSPLDAYKTVFFWSACAALFAGVFVAKSERWGKPTDLDRRAAAVFGLLPLVLGACYLAKELDRVQLTLAWTGLGLLFLVAGMSFESRELRRPALALLGLCVGKALFSDTANMPLPNRVASFVGLGLVLLFGSSLYVRAGSRDEKNTPANPD